jgi:ribosomal-protein-alanine N-acetyltransferase
MSQFQDEILIRAMQVEDLDQVQEVDRRSFIAPWPASAYRYELYENPNSSLWVAEVHDPEGHPRVVGVIVLWLIVGEAHIASLAVDPDYRARGIGGRLLVAALQEAVQQGMETATLEVRANNQVAQNLYRRFHFQVAGRRTRYYRDNNEDALIMTIEGLGRSYAQWLSSGAWNSRAAKSGDKGPEGNGKPEG